MDCRDFRENHFAFVDDTLSGIELVPMARHIAECEQCAKHDAAVRRALLLFRNLPPIEPSPNFRARLEERLLEAKKMDSAPAHRSRQFAAGVAIASVVMLGYIGTSLRSVDTPRDIILPPVVATKPEAEVLPIATPSASLVASVPAGGSMWTAAMYAEDAPIHFASADLRLINTTR
ncbi:MAG TPA: zf-HC2 domain-containing protein [Gemmatimonadaceae bacterium]|jgi:anti-sigma factor RsiW